MEAIKIIRPEQPIYGNIELPASKSISTRALVIRHLAPPGYQISNLSKADDAVLMDELLKTIVHSKGSGKSIELFLKNSGAVMRFLTALLAITPGKWLLNGSERLKRRPLQGLVEVLVKLGADIEYQGKKGYLPVRISGKELTGGKVMVDVTESSQFASALMLIAPVLANGLEISFSGKPVSMPYIEMTRKVMEFSGAGIKQSSDGYKILPVPYKPVAINVEPDWSSASYWFEVASLNKNCNIFLKDLGIPSLQGDAAVAEMFTDLGVHTEFLKNGVRLRNSGKISKSVEIDFTHCPDLAQTLAVTIAAHGIEGHLTGLGNLKYKETDRLAALTDELRKTGCNLEIIADKELHINPGTLKNPGFINTYNDHRMVMAFAPLALLLGNIRIGNSRVVEKSYPSFFNDMIKVGFISESAKEE